MRRLIEISAILFAAAGSVASAQSPGQPQVCPETPRTQISDALRNGSRPLMHEIMSEYEEDGKRILVAIASDNSEDAPLRNKAAMALGDYRSEAGFQLLFAWMHDPKRKCNALNALSYYRESELVPAFISLLDDKQICGEVWSTEHGHEADVFASDEAVGGLERLTGLQMEKREILAPFQHSDTAPWKAWWAKNQGVFLTTPEHFLTKEAFDEYSATAAGYGCSVNTIALSPDGKTAFSSGESYDPWARAWDLPLLTQKWIVPNGKDADDEASAFSPDGTLIAFGGQEGALKVLDASTGGRIRRIIREGDIENIAFSPDGATLAASYGNGAIRFFDRETWCEVRHIDNGEMTPGIAFSPDGNLMAAATFEKARVWDLRSGKELASLPVRPAPMPKSFADEGEYRAQLWKMAWQAAFSPDGKSLATTSEGYVQIWDFAKGKVLYQTQSGGRPQSLHFSPDGRWVVWGNWNNRIEIWNPVNGKKRAIRNEFSQGDSAMTPDGRFVLSPSGEREIAIYDLGTGKEISQLKCR